MQAVHRSTAFSSHVSRVQAQVRGRLVRRQLKERKEFFEMASEQWVIQVKKKEIQELHKQLELREIHSGKNQLAASSRSRFPGSDKVPKHAGALQEQY